MRLGTSDSADVSQAKLAHVTGWLAFSAEIDFKISLIEEGQ
jgi:hypothetical protein